MLKARDLASLFWAYGSFRFVPPELGVLVEVSWLCTCHQT